MKVKRTMKIELQTQRVLSLTKRVHSVEAWCSQCGESRKMIHPEEAAARAGVSLRAIYREVEAHQLHFIETSEGLVLICPDSVTQGQTSIEGSIQRRSRS